MTKKTALDWLDTYYPVPADQCPKEDAVAHSLRKFEGLRPEALKEHGLRLLQGCVFDDNDNLIITLGRSSCALCASYFTSPRCSGCPLSLAEKECEVDENPYTEMIDRDDPEPMIAAMKEILKQQA